MTADKLRILGDLWASNAFGDFTEWQKLGSAELRAECAVLHEHWANLGWNVGMFNAQDMLEFLRLLWQPPTFLIGDEHVDTTVEADSLEDALEAARDWARDGSWDHRCEVDVFAVMLNPLVDDGRDRRGAISGVRVWTTVEVGEDPPEPECEEADEHVWCSPLSVLGGCKENPGVWSEGGTKMVFRKVCRHCGCYRTETSVGAQRNPGELDRVEYDKPDEASLRWVSRCSKKDC